MNDLAKMTDLLEEVEADLRTDGIVCLYVFSWFQNIGRRPHDRDEIVRLSSVAYDELLRRHPHLTLSWITWPDVSPEEATPAAPGTEPDFILDHENPTGGRLLALVDRPE